MHVLTPPYHFSIVACPLAQSSSPSLNGKDILYRGSIPQQRNYRFLRRLGIRTLIYLRKEPLDNSDPLVDWANKRKIDLKWVKAESMTEEKLGMGRGEINEVIKIILDPTNYPVYLADGDGVSHTVLVIACLRKMMGWHIDSIIGEICRFEPEYEDYSLVPFITSYLSLSTSSSSSTPPSDVFTLPAPPYPSWLWPQSSLPLSLTRTSTRDRSSSAITTSPASALPFPHPLVARRHPTMKLGFGNLPPPSSSTPLSPSLSSNVGPGIQENVPLSTRNPLSRVPTRSAREERSTTTDENERPVTPTAQSPGIRGTSGLSGALSLNDDDEIRLGEPRSPVSTGVSQAWTAGLTGSPDRMSRLMQASSSTEQSVVEDDTSGSDRLAESPEDEDEDEFDDEEEDDDEEDEDGDDDLQSTSQYISALDLAGY